MPAGADDRVDGGPGLDSLFGDLSSCSSWSCPAGNDQLFARGEADAVNCGAGADVAQVDARDTVAQDGFQACETVDRADVPAPGDGGGGGQVQGGGRSVVAGPLKAASVTGGIKLVTVKITLRRATRVTVTVKRGGARRALGTVTFRLPAGRSTRTVRRVGRKSLSPGTYLLTIRAGASKKTVTVRVRAPRRARR